MFLLRKTLPVIIWGHLEKCCTKCIDLGFCTYVTKQWRSSRTVWLGKKPLLYSCERNLYFKLKPNLPQMLEKCFFYSCCFIRVSIIIHLFHLRIPAIDGPEISQKLEFVGYWHKCIHGRPIHLILKRWGRIESRWYLNLPT